MSWRLCREIGGWDDPVSRLTFRGPLPGEPGLEAVPTVSEHACFHRVMPSPKESGNESCPPPSPICPLTLTDILLLQKRDLLWPGDSWPDPWLSHKPVFLDEESKASGIHLGLRASALDLR